jgi:hypothetical protein
MTHLSLSTVLLLGLLMVSTDPPVASYCLEVVDGSRLYLEGSSNVNTFTCECESMDKLPPLQLKMHALQGRPGAYFENARISIRTQTLDCGHRGINSDLYESLKASHHPNISLVLDEVHWKTGEPLKGQKPWQWLTACAELTVAGVTREIDLKVHARQLSPKTFRFVSKHRIRMTDFGVSPPTALFGAVKVDNEIDLHFDLVVQAD